MISKRNIYLISLAAFTVIAAVLLFTFTFRAGAKKIALNELSREIASVEGDTKKITEENEKTEKEISDIDTELSTKATINSYYMEYKKTHDDLTNEVAELKKQSSELDGQIEKKQSELDSSSALSEGKRGKQYALKKDGTYACPDDIPAGRYSVSGGGTFTVISLAGKVRLSQNLDVAYDNSYTFNLDEQERIRVTGDVTLTEIK